ncbi:MAG: hypothetical protein QM723_34760 [Myxococcaceae bacterium]
MNTLAKEPKLDGVLKDFIGAQDLKYSAKDAKEISAKLGFKKDTVFIAVTLPGKDATSTDQVVVDLFFPGAGTTARGYKYLFGPDGQHKDPVAAPSWGQDLVQSGAEADKKALNYEIAIPGRAFPRFPGTGQLTLQLCVALVHKDGTELSNCEHGEMQGGPTRVPDEFRKNVKLNPPATVEGVESRPTGWVGFAVLHYPVWVQGDNDLTPESIAALSVGDAAVEAIKVDLPIPTSLTLPDMRPIFTVLTGKNPYTNAGECHGDSELRMAMYVVKGNSGARVLEWPAATCSLGRASRFELNPEGQLTIGYTNGSTAHFVWSGDHFERSELGSK